MGSFAYTCCISGFPIEAGDPVRYLALTENRYKQPNEWTCYVSDRWQLRTVPLRGVYNDYGSVERIQDGLVKDVFFQGFDTDVIEEGVGDNTCHDVAVKKGMDVEAWLEALWEGRVFVDPDAPRRNPHWKYDASKYDSERPKGLPTMFRIENILKAANKTGFIVSEVSHGFVRVRVDGYESFYKVTSKLEALLPLFGDFACMITVGTGNYAAAAELLIAPKPQDPKESDKPGQHIFAGGVNDKRNEKRKPKLAVSQAMVREDVWNILLNGKVEVYTGKAFLKKNFAYFRTQASKMLAQDQADEAKLAAKKEEIKKSTSNEEVQKLQMELEDLVFRSRREFPNDNLISRHIQGGEGVTGYSLKSAYELARKMDPKGEKMEPFLNDLAETVFVQDVYATLRGLWHPMSGGPQFGAWKEHRAFHKELAKLKGR